MLKDLLLKAPDSQLDKSMHPFIEKWDETPKAIQILEVLDYCAHGALASDFVISLLEQELEDAVFEEQITYEELIKSVTWRD